MLSHALTCALVSSARILDNTWQHIRVRWPLRVLPRTFATVSVQRSLRVLRGWFLRHLPKVDVSVF